MVWGTGLSASPVTPSTSSVATAASARPIAVVLNPHARKNRPNLRARARRLESILGGAGTLYETASLGELRQAMGDLLDRGAEWVVTGGGDGTVHWVLNEALGAIRRRARAERLPSIVPTNGGTIDFLARKAGITGNAESILHKLVGELDRGSSPVCVELDTLDIRGTIRTEAGTESLHRLGFTLAAGGIGQRFFTKYYAEPVLGPRGIVSVVAKAVGSYLADRARLPLSEQKLAYGRTIFAPTPARVTIDDEELECRAHGAIHAGSLDVSLGGVFRVFPLARDPGRLHFQAGGIVPLEMIRALPDLARGGAIKSRHLREVAGERMTVEALGDELLEPIIDGESFHDLSALEVGPGPRIVVPTIRS
jgi:diacylglycerol kinase family enzyme